MEVGDDISLFTFWKSPGLLVKNIKKKLFNWQNSEKVNGNIQIGLLSKAGLVALHR